MTCADLAAAKLIALDKRTDEQISAANLLIKHFWPGPLTLILPKHILVSDLVTSSLSTVAIRCPAHRIAQALIRVAGIPLAAPSANRFGRISPTSAQHVVSELGEYLNYCVDGGDCQVGLESTICMVMPAGTLMILREGGISRERIHDVMHKKLLPSLKIKSDARTDMTPLAPGMLESHYAPVKMMVMIKSSWDVFGSAELRAVLYQNNIDSSRKISVLSAVELLDSTKQRIRYVLPGAVFYALSQSIDDSVAAAQKLFAMLRRLDEDDSSLILCEVTGFDQGLWPAIADRLTRASKQI